MLHIISDCLESKIFNGDAMFGFWEFAVVAVIVWGIVQITMYTKGIYKKENKGKQIKKDEKEDIDGLLIGGLIMLFIGFAFFVMGYVSSGYKIFGDAGIVFVSFLVGGIGMALLLSYYILSGKPETATRKPTRPRKKGKKR